MKCQQQMELESEKMEITEKNNVQDILEEKGGEIANA